MTSKLTREENVQAVFDLKAGYKLGLADVEILKRVASMALAAMDSEPSRNPVLAYADSYRDMAKQGVESVPIWSVITDLERNIAPLYRQAQPAPVVNEDLYILANHIASSKSGLPDEWLDWAEELETDIRRAAMLQADNDEIGSWSNGKNTPTSTSITPASPDRKLTDDVLDEIIAGAKTSMEQYLALSLKAEREVWRKEGPTDDERIMAIEGIHNCERCGDEMDMGARITSHRFKV
ncbi:hypothetical protein [Klebsiella sp. Q11]|uniref:hypothetical protein n=1 Tax=Klebsiella sp. Q11 TaxID=857461 RepID=UPI003567D91B